MRLFALCLTLLTAACAGCQSAGTNSVPAIDPFAAYGHTRIAPPTTGSYGAPRSDPYYSGAVGATEASVDNVASSQVNPAVNLVDATKQPAHEASTAGFVSSESTELVKLASNEDPIRIVERVGPASEGHTDLRGMAVVDATGTEPARLAANTSTITHVPTGQPATFQAPEGAATIRILPSEESDQKPLPVRGFSPSNPSSPATIQPAAPDATLPPATIQAGRFVPLDIATRRNSSSVNRSIVASN